VLKSRIITATLLLLVLLAALFLLPPLIWVLLVVAMVMQGTAEWARLSGLQGRRATLYWGATLLLMLGLLWLGANTDPSQRNYIHLAVYLVSAVLWLMVVPAWLITGMRVTQPVLMMGVGWAVLIPTGLAMIDLREATPSPWVLLFVMGLVWVADMQPILPAAASARPNWPPASARARPGKGWPVRSSACQFMWRWYGPSARNFRACKCCPR